MTLWNTAHSRGRTQNGSEADIDPHDYLRFTNFFDYVTATSTGLPKQRQLADHVRGAITHVAVFRFPSLYPKEKKRLESRQQRQADAYHLMISLGWNLPVNSPRNPPAKKFISMGHNRYQTHVFQKGNIDHVSDKGINRDTLWSELQFPEIHISKP